MKDNRYSRNALKLQLVALVIMLFALAAIKA